MTVLRRHWALLLALFLALIVLLPYSIVELGRDQANWLTVAMALESGSVMYRDVAVVNTPGLGVLFAAVNGITGTPTLTPWIVHVLTVLATILAGTVWVRRGFGKEAAAGAALITALLWPQSMDWWDLAQKDGVAFALALSSGALLALTGNRRVITFIAGALLAAAVLVKTSSMIYALPLAYQLYVTTEEREQLLRRALWMGAGGLAALLAPAVYLSYHEAWGSAWASLFERASAYGGFRRRSLLAMVVQLSTHVFGALSVSLALPILWMWRRPPTRSAKIPLGGMLLAGVALFLLQGRGWNYHVVPVVAACSLGLGAILGQILSGGVRWKKIVAMAVVVAAICLSWAGNERWFRYALRITGPLAVAEHEELFKTRRRARPMESRQVADWIRQSTKPSDRIFVWGMESQIYVYSERMFVGPSFADAPIWHPQLALKKPEYFLRQRARFYSEIMRNRPAVFVVVRRDANAVEPWPSDRSLRSLPELVSFLKDHYTLHMRTEHFLVYKRSDDRGQGPPL